MRVEKRKTGGGMKVGKERERRQEGEEGGTEGVWSE